MSDQNKTTPVHQWTHGGDRVMIVKIVENDGTSYNGFKWPLEVGAETHAPDANNKAECNGGLFGWPWGIGFGDGKDPNAHKTHIVFSAPASEVIAVDRKCKAIGKVRVEYVGTQEGAMTFTLLGRIGWVEANSKVGKTNATGGYSSLSATGEYSSLSATGESSSLSATGGYSSLSATGGYSSLSATGGYSSLSATGWYSSLSATGWYSSLSATGWYSSLSATGEYSSLSATGESSSLSATGGYSSLSATGEYSMASATGGNSTIEVSGTSLAAVVAERVTWKVRKGAILVQRWKGGYKLFTSGDMEDGAMVKIQRGEIVKEFSYE